MPGIPKRVIQVWGGTEMPLFAKASAANARLLNPDFEYMLLDDAKMDRMITDDFPQYAGIIRSFRLPIQKYDFLRYLAVYRFGGIYMDMDVFLASDLSDLLAYGCVFPFERLAISDFLRHRYGMDWEIGNYAFGAEAGHPFLRAVIANCVRAQEDRAWREVMTRSLPGPLREEMFVIYSTGPGLVSRTLAEYDDREHPVKVLFPENVCDKQNSWNRFGTYGVHLCGGSWRAPQSRWRKRLVDFLARRYEARAIAAGRRLGPTRHWGTT
jgi:inositol phosphorylceramide mannosyltransferase catalytic subunit